MANKLYEESDIQAIAIAIRAKKGTSNTYTVAQMAGAVTSADPTLQNKTVTPSTSAQSITADTGYDGLGTVTVGAIQTEEKSVLPSTSAQNVTPTSGKYLSQVGVAAMPSGTLSTPTVNSSGLVTAAVGTSGYLASGTSKTLQLTTQAAQTITPGTSAQTISAGRYLTGAQTIAGDANLVAENIADGVSIFGVTGTHSGGTLPSFEQCLTPLGRSNWYSMVYGNDMFVAVSQLSANGGYSYDGVTWNSIVMPQNTAWRNIAYGNGRFVAISSSEGIAAYTDDGINWTQTDTGLTNTWAIAYGMGKFVTIQANTNIAAYSEDGIAWTQTSVPVSSKWYDIAYGNGKFVAISSTNSCNTSVYSTDGITWNSSTLPASAAMSTIVFGGGKFVVAGVFNTYIYYSTNGTAWTSINLPSLNTNYWRNAAYGAGIFIILSQSSSQWVYSRDAINWSILDATSTSGYPQTIGYGKGVFSAIGDSSISKTSYYCDVTPTFA